MTNELEATEAEMNGAADATGDMEKATVDAGDAAEETGSRFGGLGTALKTVAGLAAATAASVAAATGKLVKDVVSSFSELEQNTGGAEAVFGEYASAIQKTGEEAYKNLGVSQSEYLATANKMGALFQRLRHRAADVSRADRTGYAARRRYGVRDGHRNKRRARSRSRRGKGQL